MKLEEAIAGLPKRESDHVKEAVLLLRTHGSGEAQRFMANADAEFRLPASAWAVILKPIVAVDIAMANRDAARRVLTAFRAGLADCMTPIAGPASVPNRTPAGEEIPNLEPQAFGRLVSRDALQEAWKNLVNNPSGRRRRSKKRLACDLIEQLSGPGGLAAYSDSRNLKNLPLGRYVIWSTFDGESLSVNPFPDRPLSMLELSALMGLDYNLLFPGRPDFRRSKPFCLILTYTLPANVKPYIPSIAEAYAGTMRLNYYFHLYGDAVDVSMRRFPRTLPTPAVQDSHGAPEVVHSVIAADQLIAPIEISRFA